MTLLESIQSYISDWAVWRQALAVFVLACFPVIDRLAIPLAYIVGIPWYVALTALTIGNITPAPFLLLLIKRVFKFLRRFKFFAKIIAKLEAHAERKSATVKKFQFAGLVAFVAVPLPLPGTGVWTGSLIAVILGLRVKYALIALAIGAALLGVIMTGLTYGLFDTLFGG